ncbi:MAG: alpha-amylase, partial [Acidobacteria bacterium]|nr:alpha-amylase [Acidobacteriota bacterium]
FWREVVDRVAQEAPDTLLLAEAFWMMEGYFVRTLGMHRVYNSAFMNMLRDEENAKFRKSLKNTLAFQPEILRRFVNYVTTPDEESAVRQVGKGDKYFGICTLMATLPGLPLVGHGQFEGLSEKYGMEYRRAYAEETPDRRLLARHEREVVPLLTQRYLFSGVERFELYDFDAPAGVDEDVFAFSNGWGRERVLVVFHNRSRGTRGRLKTSVPRLVTTSEEDGSEEPVRVPLAHALGLKAGPLDYCRFRDRRSGLEFLANSREVLEKGLLLTLGPYRCRVFCDFEELAETSDLRLERLARKLAGEGVPSLQEALEDLFAGQADGRPELLPPTVLLLPLFGGAEGGRAGVGAVEPSALDALEAWWLEASEALESLPASAAPEKRREEPDLPGGPTPSRPPAGPRGRVEAAIAFLRENEEDGPLASFAQPQALVLWALLGNLEGLPGFDSRERLLAYFDVHRLGRRIEALLGELGCAETDLVPGAAAVRLFLGLAPDSRPLPSAAELLESWLAQPEVRHFLGVHEFGGVTWFRQEAFRTFLWWWQATAAVEASPSTAAVAAGLVAPRRRRIEQLLEAEEASEYRLEGLRRALGSSGRSSV